MARVWEKSRHAGSELLMLLALADFSDDEGRAYPAVPTLAKKCRMTPRNANLILAALRRTGELVIRKNEGPKGTNLYQIAHHPTPEAAFIPEERFTLKPPSAPPETGFLKPLKPASDEPSVNHQEPSTRRDAAKPHRSKNIESVPDGFVDFWNAYDKKNGKTNALKEWKQIKPDAALVQLIISAATSYSASREQRYRKDPERWLKGRMWEDEQHAHQSDSSQSSPEWMEGAL